MKRHYCHQKKSLHLSRLPFFGWPFTFTFSFASIHLSKRLKMNRLHRMSTQASRLFKFKFHTTLYCLIKMSTCRCSNLKHYNKIWNNQWRNQAWFKIFKFSSWNIDQLSSNLHDIPLSSLKMSKILQCALK